MADFFVYVLISIEGLSKPVLIETTRVSEIYNGNEKDFDFVKHMKDKFGKGNTLISGIYIMSPNIGWTIYYSKTLPSEYYTVSEGFLVDA